MITQLKNKKETIGFVLMYSDQTDSFPDDFKNILLGISPHLSNAVANIITNEELLDKEKEKSFLLDFSIDIATVRTKRKLAVSSQCIKPVKSTGRFCHSQDQRRQQYDKRLCL